MRLTSRGARRLDLQLRIFVSHASIDEPLAAALVDCLLGCMILRDSDVRCTSVAGHKLSIGSETATMLRDELEDTSVVIGLLTPNAVSSSWVLFELGATWGAKRRLIPLLAGGLEFQSLPGPLAGHHSVRLADKNGLAQAVEEIAGTIGVEKRSAAKIDAALDKLVAVAREFEAAQTDRTSRVKLSGHELIIAGVPMSELLALLGHEKVKIPSLLSGKSEPVEMSVLDLFINNFDQFANGLQSNWDPDTSGGFLYQKVAMQLLPYELVKYEKLPASQARWFKRLVLSAEGRKFVAQCKRLLHGSPHSGPSKQ